jgi:formamidopyrimidine-DNA glycosylase
MPELPEVQTVVQTLRPRVLGEVIAKVRVLRQDVIRPAGLDLDQCLGGRRVEQIARRGKKIIVTLEDGQRLVVHLGMTGRLTVENAAAAMLPHTHVVMELGRGMEIRFRDPRRFGGIWWLGSDGSADAGLGPEPLQMTAAELARRLSRTRRAVKTALLDQSLLAGLGNIYADESLFAAGIHPLTAANALSRPQIAALSRAIKATLRRSLRHKGSTLRDYRDANGRAGEFQKLLGVYDREGKPCRQCRTPIARRVIGGRSAHFCPVCQPALGGGPTIPK